MTNTMSTAHSILERLKQGTGARTDSEFARLLGISQQSVSNARNNERVPDSWVRCTAEQFNLSADWLFFGRGTMHVEAGPTKIGAPTPDNVSRVSMPSEGLWGAVPEEAKDLRIRELEQQLAAAKEETLNVYRLLAQYYPMVNRGMRDVPTGLAHDFCVPDKQASSAD